MVVELICFGRIDFPEVSTVAILDADKEGYLRSSTALIQTIGRAARHVNGKVIMYADKITKSINMPSTRQTEEEKYNLITKKTWDNTTVNSKRN